ncbi:unnamed protein product, partial [Citrullus colocynthis]
YRTSALIVVHTSIVRTSHHRWCLRQQHLLQVDDICFSHPPPKHRPSCLASSLDCGSW